MVSSGDEMGRVPQPAPNPQYFLYAIQVHIHPHDPLLPIY